MSGGANAGGMSGTQGQGGGVPFGMPGGMDLAQLLAQLQGSDVGVGAGSDILQSITQGSFGQQVGGLGGGSFGQTQPGYVAGQSSAGGTQSAQQQAAGSADPLAILQKVLGLAKTGIGLASPLMQDFGGLTQDDISPESRAAFEQQRAGERVASPFVPDLSSFDNAQGSLGYVAGDSQPESSFNTEFLGGMEEDVEAGGYRPGLGESTTSSELSGADLGGAGQSGGGGSTPGTNFIGAAQGGLGSAMGLLNLLQGIEGSNPTLGVGGGLQTIGGLTSLLQSSPQLAQALGLGSGALGATGAITGGLGGLLGLYSGIQTQDPKVIAQSLASLYGTTVPTINSLAGTNLPTLTGLATSALEGISPGIMTTLAGVAPAAITGAVGAGAGLGSLAGGAAAAGSAIGTGGGMAGAGIAGTAGAGATGGVTAGLTAAMAPAAMIMGPYIVAKLIQMGQGFADAPNMRQLQNRVENIYGQLPGQIATLQGIPGIASQLTAGSTPEQAADILKQLNAMQDQYQAGGWESHQKTGGTSVQSIGEGNMQVDLPQVKNALDRMNPYFHLMDLTRLRAQDTLSRMGWSPEQIQQRTGRYIGPQEWAMNLLTPA